jgi:dipeptidyl aminopeptidase/acylaminoacyl peptidase
MLLLLACGGTLSESQSERSHKVSLEDLETLRYADYLRLSPDGKMLAYVVAGDIYLVATKAESLPRRLGPGTVPIWSPDNNFLAFYSNASGSNQLWVANSRNDQSEQITNLKGGIDPDPWTALGGWYYDPLLYSWSPDSSKLVFVSRVARDPTESGSTPVKNDLPAPAVQDNTPLILTTSTPIQWTLAGIFAHGFGERQWLGGRNVLGSGLPGDDRVPPSLASQLFIVDVGTKHLEQVTTDDAGYFNPDWSPDSKHIVCASNEGRSLIEYGAEATNIYSIDLLSRVKVALTRGPGDKRLPSWSPNGELIAYVSARHFGMQSVFVIGHDGGNPVDMTSSLNRTVTEFHWTPDSGSIVVLVTNGVLRPIIRIKLKDRRIEDVVSGSASREHTTISASGTLAWEESEGSRHGVLRSVSSTGTSPETLIDLNPQIRQWNLGIQTIVRWKNSRGEPLEGVLITPTGYESGHRYPLIVDAYPMQGNWFRGYPMTGNQAWASSGYAIFWPNARAPHMWVNHFMSESYDRAARGPDGWNVTVDDVLSGVNELVRSGIVDPSRIGLYGFSNGGGIVDYLVTRTHRFKCAVSVAAVYPDWSLPFFLHSDSKVTLLEGGDDPIHSPEAYIGISAVYHLQAVRTPMLLADGDDDADFLLGMIEMYNGLRWLGGKVTLLRYPNQGHGFTDVALKDFWERENAFFEKYLKPEQAPN